MSKKGADETVGRRKRQMDKVCLALTPAGFSVLAVPVCFFHYATLAAPTLMEGSVLSAVESRIKRKKQAGTGAQTS